MKSKSKDKKYSREAEQETGHYRRYPEEEIIDALEEEDRETKHAGTELAEHFRAVTGRKD